jgi:hypothetical protein
MKVCKLPYDERHVNDFYFVVYFAMLYQTIQCWMVRLLMNTELDKIWEEVSWPNWGTMLVLSWWDCGKSHTHAHTYTKNSVRITDVPAKRDSNWAPHEYKSRALLLHQHAWYSVVLNRDSYSIGKWVNMQNVCPSWRWSRWIFIAKWTAQYKNLFITTA